MKPIVINMLRIFLVLCVQCTLITHAVESRALDAIVDKGLKALVSLQRPDGGFGASRLGPDSVAGMALLAGGHTPTRGLYKDASRLCLERVLRAQDAMTGYLSDNGNMYDHGFATLYLAECYGMTPNPRIRKAIIGAVNVIYRSQNQEGGWRYDPTPNDADISVTVCQINAIRSVYNAGLGGEQAQQVIAKALTYVRSCHNGNGTFRYRAQDGGTWGAKGVEGVPRTAAGTMSLMGGGVYSTADAVLNASLANLREHVVGHLHKSAHYYWYGQYYASQAMFHSADRADWNLYWNAASEHIIGLQQANGVWAGPDANFGPSYNTAFALIILQIPNNYLPIFQR